MLFFSHLILLLFSKPCCSSASHVVLQPSNPVILQQAMQYFSHIILLFFSKPCILLPSNPFILQQAMLFFSLVILSASHAVVQPSNTFILQQAINHSHCSASHAVLQSYNPLLFSKPCCSSRRWCCWAGWPAPSCLSSQPSSPSG